MTHFRAVLLSQEDAHGMFQQHCKHVHVSGTTNPRANVLTDSVSIASKMRQTLKRSSPSQSAINVEN